MSAQVRPVRTLTGALLLTAGILAPQAAPQNGSPQTTRTEKKVTVIAAESKADGSSEVRKELLEECIRTLPPADALVAEVRAESRYLREINGEAGRNAHTKVYSARVDLNYLLHQKELIIVTTRSVEGQAPVLREAERKLRQSQTFTSDASSGDIFAGRSDRQYYFSTPDGAANDAKARAATWIRQQSGALCPEK